VNIKSIVYRSALTILQFYWRLRGGRRVTVFGLNLKVRPDTIFPSYRKFRLPKGDCISQIVKYSDYVQIHAVCNTVSELQNEPVIIDIGAHHGAYAILIGKLVQHLDGKVVAVEPNPESFQVLVDNVRINGLADVVMCEQLAVSEKSGIMNITIKGSESQIVLQQTEATLPVEVVTMRQLLDKHKISSVDVLIVDVEGAELSVLRGYPWDSVKVKKIFCELHPYAWHNFGYDGEAIKLFLETHGYRCFDMYFKEHKLFDRKAYIGPTLFVPVVAKPVTTVRGEP
jgi:FkbM family methyltransferase